MFCVSHHLSPPPSSLPPSEKLKSFSESLPKDALDLYPSSVPCPTSDRCPERAYTTMVSDIRVTCPNNDLAWRAAGKLTPEVSSVSPAVRQCMRALVRIVISLFMSVCSAAAEMRLLQLLCLWGWLNSLSGEVLSKLTFSCGERELQSILGDFPARLIGLFMVHGLFKFFSAAEKQPIWTDDEWGIFKAQKKIGIFFVSWKMKKLLKQERKSEPLNLFLQDYWEFNKTLILSPLKRH